MSESLMKGKDEQGAVPQTDEQMRGFYVPIGVPMGQWKTGGNPAFGVRSGSTFHDLDTNEFRIWSAGLDAPNPRGLAERTSAVSVEDLRRSMTRLTHDGLMFRMGNSEELDNQFLRAHRLLGIGFGLGQLSEDQSMFGIGGHDLVSRVSVDPLLYAIWIGIGGCASMWETCEVLSADVAQPVSFVAAHLIEAMPSLIRSGVVLIDRV